MVRQVVDEMEKDRANDPLLLNDTIDRMPTQMIAVNIGTNQWACTFAKSPVRFAIRT